MNVRHPASYQGGAFGAGGYNAAAPGYAGAPPYGGQQQPSNDAFSNLLTDLCRVYEEMWYGAPASAPEQKNYMPIFLNLRENEDYYYITADLSDVREEDIDVSYQDGVLTINAERKCESNDNEEDKTVWHIVERPYGSFRRSLPLPPNVYADKISANYVNGALTIAIPKDKSGEPADVPPSPLQSA